MEELKNAEIAILLSNNTKEELAEKLAFYEDLVRSGNVYFKEPPVDHSSVVELLKMSTGISSEQLSALLDFGFHKNADSQFRSISKVNKQRNFLNLSMKLAKTYFREHQCCSPRIKGSITTDEILDCRSNVKNVYPMSYIKHVKSFLEHNPIEKWHKKNSSSDIDKHFTKQEDSEKFQCKYCKRLLKKNSRKKHLQSCKEYKKIEEDEEIEIEVEEEEEKE